MKVCTEATVWMRRKATAKHCLNNGANSSIAASSHNYFTVFIESLLNNRLKIIAHLQRFVDRFGAKATLATRAKSKGRQIDRLKAAAVRGRIRRPQSLAPVRE